MPIRVVSFDMEGTLIDHAYSKQIWEGDIPALYAEAHGLTLEEARKRVLAEYSEVGEGQPEWYDVGYWWKRFGLPHYWRDLPKRRKGDCNVYPDVPNVLMRLGKHYPLIVSSNTIREFLNVQLKCIDYHFSRVFSAPTDFRSVKKAPDFYQRVCDILEIEPTELAHVGDHAEFDYTAPKQLGVEAYHLDRSGELRGVDVVHDLNEFAERLL
ncbi:MAG: HAD family hydrolase [Candidatus Bathyarchaeia archaeon]